MISIITKAKNQQLVSVALALTAAGSIHGCKSDDEGDAVQLSDCEEIKIGTPAKESLEAVVRNELKRDVDRRFGIMQDRQRFYEGVTFTPSTEDVTVHFKQYSSGAASSVPHVYEDYKFSETIYLDTQDRVDEFKQYLNGDWRADITAPDPGNAGSRKLYRCGLGENDSLACDPPLPDDLPAAGYEYKAKSDVKYDGVHDATVVSAGVVGTGEPETKIIYLNGTDGNEQNNLQKMAEAAANSGQSLHLTFHSNENDAAWTTYQERKNDYDSTGTLTNLAEQYLSFVESDWATGECYGVPGKMRMNSQCPEGYQVCGSSTQGLCVDMTHNDLLYAHLSHTKTHNNCENENAPRCEQYFQQWNACAADINDCKTILFCASESYSRNDNEPYDCYTWYFDQQSEL